METSTPAGPPCPECGEPVPCGAAAGRETCWCMELTPVEPRAEGAQPACLCERCLRRRVEAERAESAVAGERGR